MKKTALHLLPRIIFVISATLLILIAKGWQYDFDENRIIRTGIIDINSTPKGAEVMLNSEYHGTTPTSISGLMPDRYLVTLEKEGYQPWQEWTYVNPELITRLNGIRLFPVQALVTRQTYDSSLYLSLDEESGNLISIKTDPDSGAPRLNLLNQDFNTIYDSSFPAQIADIYQLSSFWSPNNRYLLLNISLANLSSEHLVKSLVYDTSAADQEPTEIDPEGLSQELIQYLVRPVWTSDNRSIYYIDATDTLQAFDLMNEQSSKLTDMPQGSSLLAFVPASNLFTRAYFIVAARQPDRSLTLWTKDYPDGEPVPITLSRSLKDISGFRLSPDRQNFFLQDDGSALILTNYKSENIQEKLLTRPIQQVIGWSHDSEKFLFISEDCQITYYDQKKNNFLYPYQQQDNETIISACWHDQDQHIFFLTQEQEKKNTYHQISVTEIDGKNTYDIYSDQQGITYQQESIDISLPLRCQRDQLVISSWIEKENASDLRFLYTISIE